MRAFILSWETIRFLQKCVYTDIRISEILSIYGYIYIYICIFRNNWRHNKEHIHKGFISYPMPPPRPADGHSPGPNSAGGRILDVGHTWEIAGVRELSVSSGKRWVSRTIYLTQEFANLHWFASNGVDEGRIRVELVSNGVDQLGLAAMREPRWMMHDAWYRYVDIYT